MENELDLEGKSVLVTGAGGFIGSHLVERLVGEGAKVRAFVHYNSRNDPGLMAFLPKDVQDQVEIRAGDLRDPHAVYEAIRDVRVVFHLGALISIPYSYRHPFEVAETNLMGAMNVLGACRELEIARLIHTSTSEVYGTARHVPISEDHPLQGQSPYSASKIGADKLAESFFCAYELPVVTVRPFNTYGPRQSDRAVIPTIITQALTQEKILLGNLDARRDLTFVSDTVDGFIKAATTQGIEGEVFNLGTGMEVTILDLAEKIITQAGGEVDIEVDPQRLRPDRSEVQRLMADSTKALKVLGWEPKVALDDGLKYTIDWFRENIGNYQAGMYRF
jgi:NAD dependent epimerase/dehydratase